MDIADLFFEDLIAMVSSLSMGLAESDAESDTEFSQGWNLAIQTCLIRLHYFFGKSKPSPDWLERLPQTTDTCQNALTVSTNASTEASRGSDAKTDPVNHPSHYTAGKIEVIDFIEDQKLGYHLGNVVKYICRAGRKDSAKIVEDLLKARWYLKRYMRFAKQTPAIVPDEEAADLTEAVRYLEQYIDILKNGGVKL